MSEPFETIACPDRETWLAKRREGIGASEAAVVLGVSPWQKPHELWGLKVGLLEATREETEAMVWGLRLEDAIAQAYGEETGREVVNPGRFTIRRSRAHPFAFATLDRTIVDRDRGPGLLELKTGGMYKADEWQDEPPVHYLIQVQHQMLVTGHQWASLAVLLGGQRFLWVDVERNEDFIAVLIEREAAFWDRVIREEQPAIDGSDSAKALLARLFPKETGETIALPREAVTWDARRMELKAAIKAADDELHLIENTLKASIGDAAYGLLPDGTRYSWKTVSKKGYEVQPQEYRELRRLAPRK